MRDRGQQWAHGAVIPPPASAPPPPPPPSSGRPVPLPARIAHEVDQLTDELLTALHHYRVAKRLFAARTAVLEHKHGGPTADIAGRTDYLRAKAISDCSWWRGEVMAASNALIALHGLAGGDRP